MYGITETTVHVSYLELDKNIAELRANSLIGRGIPDLNVYVLDDRLEPVPRASRAKCMWPEEAWHAAT